jgi:membrane associated rhomboid family serine protease
MLLIVNMLAFLLQWLLPTFSSFPLIKYCALSLDGLRHGYVWQLVTFQFLHDGAMHLLGNCLVIYFFGQLVEETLGRWPFLRLYFASGIIGGLFQTLAGIIFGGAFAASVVGASAGAFGLIAAFALLFPEQTILLFMFIPMRAKYLLVLEAAVAMMGVFGLLLPGTAHAAHLGGMITGIFYIRYAIHWNFRWPNLRRTSSRQPPRRLVRVSSGSSALWEHGKPNPQEELPPAEFLSKEVDPILDKINTHGIKSLTERERRILKAAGQKIEKR